MVRFVSSLLCVLSLAGCSQHYVARPLTRPGEFTPGIEGPACGRDGSIYAVNFTEQGTIGRISPSGKGEVFLKLPADSVGNGIRFDRAGNMYIADYVNHQVFKVDAGTSKPVVFASNSMMNQPNDLAISFGGTLYASDPNWPAKTGQLWKITVDGRTTRLAEKMGTTNGIEVSPDGRTLYVNESAQRKIWSFAIDSAGNLSGKQLFKSFEDHGFDGMRCDVDGNLYVTRYGKGTVVKLSPSGKVLAEIDVLGKKPSNICFGGPDGRTAYVTEVEHTRIVSFRVERPGLAWSRLFNR
ncbi:MAG: SMP-30/gluconolactonase/LRE family protein [Planctomycetota bacterium]